MTKNNNRKVISRMAGRSLNNNRRRSMIMIMAVALATFYAVQCIYGRNHLF